MSGELADQMLLHFRLQEKIGQGGMGVVYRATDERLLRTVALKVLPPDHVGNKDRRQRFLQEARSAAAVTHANIATVYEVGEADGRVFIAMELVEGTSLREKLKTGPLPAADALRIARDVARGLAKAHEKGVVHRDLKPDNVMIGNELEVKVLDFGLAKLRQDAQNIPEGALDSADTVMRVTMDGSLLGTPAYMSPEQATGNATDHRTDIFSLGVVLYEMVTGSRPFKGRSAMEVIIAVSRDTPEAPSKLNPAVTPELEQVILRCLAKDPEGRYGSARELLQALEQLSLAPALDTPQLATPFPVRPAGAPVPRRPRRAWLLAFGGLVAVAITSGVVQRSGSSEVVPSPAAPAGLEPVSFKPEALELYKSALREWRGGMASACLTLERAATLDPALAAAHLRFAICMSTGTPALVRRSLQAAAALRSSLSDVDQGLLDAYEPIFQRQPADFKETRLRLLELARRYPLNAEIAERLGDVETQLDFRRAVEAYDRALALDPMLVNAWRYRAQMQAYLGDFEGAFESIARCLAISPGATDCRGERIFINAEQGACAEVESDARRWLTVEPTLRLPYRFLADGLFGQGRSVEAAREVLRQKMEMTPLAADLPVSRAYLQDQQRFNILRGDFVTAAKNLEEEERQVAESRFEQDHARVASMLAALYQETGQILEARRVADAFLDRRDAWEPNPLSEDWAMSKDPTGVLLALLHREGAISKEEHEERRAARLTWWDTKAVPSVRGYLWIHQYAAAVELKDEATEALAALERYRPLPKYKPIVPADFHIGRTYLLAGHVDEALPVLERMVRSCYALSHPIEHTRASYFLGVAREAKGDKAGACSAYALVRDRWGNARPRSLTAKKAIDRMKALGCAR